MESKKLKRLRKTELLELLVQSEQEKEFLREKLEECQEELHKKELLIHKAEGIAETSLKINQIFEATQSAANLYLEHVKKICKEGTEEQETKREVLEEDAIPNIVENSIEDPWKDLGEKIILTASVELEDSTKKKEEKKNKENKNRIFSRKNQKMNDRGRKYQEVSQKIRRQMKRNHFTLDVLREKFPFK